MDARTRMEVKCNGYLEQAHLVLAVTLSTYVKSDSYARSDRIRHMWDQHFIRRVRRCLPVRSPVDHDYVLEKSPDGYWHFHGVLAVRVNVAHRLWKDHRLNPRLVKDIESFARSGRYRPFRINKFVIEPIKNPRGWCRYITKESDSVLS